MLRFLSSLGESVRGSVRAGVAEYDLNLLTAPKDAPQSNSVWHGRFAGSRGIGRHKKGRGRARVSPGLRVSGRREERRIGGSSEAPLYRSEEQNGDQSGLFYVAGATL